MYAAQICLYSIDVNWNKVTKYNFVSLLAMLLNRVHIIDYYALMGAHPGLLSPQNIFINKNALKLS